MNHLGFSFKKKDADASRGATPEEKYVKPPTTVEEFMKAEKLDEWPFRLTSENPLDLEDEKAQYGNKDIIYNTLKKATSVDSSILDKLEDRLETMYEKILRFADMIFIRDDAQEEGDKSVAAITNGEDDEEAGGGAERGESATPSIKSARTPEERNRAFVTDFPENDLQMVHPSKKAKKKLGIKESLVETKKKGVENCIFPGYQDGELTSLPGNIEAPQILNKVTSAASISSGFKKYWKKIFQSEASVAIMQDAFWWIFLEYFQKRRKLAQDQLFDRIADSFVALFVSIHPEVKDKFFKVYSDCLALAIFVAFHEAFPESDQIFDRQDFKQFLTSTLSEWITGVRAQHGTWKKWPLEKLDLTPFQAPEEIQNGSKIEVTAMARGLSYHLDMDGFVKTMNKLESQAQEQYNTVDIAVPSGISFPQHRGTSVHSNIGVVSKQAALPVRESHPVGKGPAVERVMFNLSGQSPLIAHYQRMHQMKHIASLDKSIRRTEIGRPPSNTQTYRDLIEATQENSKAMHQEYERLTETTTEEIAKIERQQRELSRAIDSLKSELKETKNVVEVRHKSDQIFEKGLEHFKEQANHRPSGH